MLHCGTNFNVNVRQCQTYLWLSFKIFRMQQFIRRRKSGGIGPKLGGGCVPRLGTKKPPLALLFTMFES